MDAKHVKKLTCLPVGYGLKIWGHPSSEILFRHLKSDGDVYLVI